MAGQPGSSMVWEWRQILIVSVNLATGIQPGDIILGVDGMRIYGWQDFQLARFRNGLSTSMTILYNHKGDLQLIKLHDLQPGRDVGLNFDVAMESNRILDVMENLGLPLADETVRNSLLQLPKEAASQLDAWAKKSPSADTAWLQDFITLYMALKNREYPNVVKPAHEPPLPYFQRLEKFYLALAAANQPTETVPDVRKTGEFPEYYVLSLPLPNYQIPLGNLKFSDRRFQSLLARKYALGDGQDPEIRVAAAKYANSGADGLEQYLDQVRASILDPDTQGGLLYNSPLVQASMSQNLLIQALSDRMKDETKPDWVIDAYAMVALKYLSGATDELGSLLEDLGKRSPYFARNAAAGLFAERHAQRNKWTLLTSTRAALAKNNDFLGSNPPALYRWALDKIFPLALPNRLASGNPLPDPVFLLTYAPSAEVTALKDSSVSSVSATPSPSSSPAKP